MWGRSARRLALTLAAISFAVACNKTADKPAEPPPPPEPEVAKAPDAQVTSLSEMAVEYEKLEQQQASTNQQMTQLISKYQSRGGSLPPGFGADLPTSSARCSPSGSRPRRRACARCCRT
jgi:hypothetical protein